MTNQPTAVWQETLGAHLRSLAVTGPDEMVIETADMPTAEHSVQYAQSFMPRVQMILLKCHGSFMGWIEYEAGTGWRRVDAPMQVDAHHRIHTIGQPTHAQRRREEARLRIPNDLRKAADIIESGDRDQWGRASWRISKVADWLRRCGWGQLPGIDVRDDFGIVLADEADAAQAKYRARDWMTPDIARALHEHR